MTGLTFRWQVIGVGLLVVVLSSLAIVASYLWAAYEDGLRAVPAILIPIGAAWLAFCWQRRVSFTKALFDVWQKMVITIQDVIQYTYLPAPSQADFAKVKHSLSCRIDDIRGAFRNVKEKKYSINCSTRQYIFNIKKSQNLSECDDYTKKYRLSNRPENGYYPFESLKQITRVVDLLGHGPGYSIEEATKARKTIISLWQVLRGELLKELDRDFPEHSDTPHTPRKNHDVAPGPSAN